MARRQTSKKTDSIAGLPTRMFVSIVVAGFVLSLASVLFAQTDEGVINVAQVINESNAAAQASDDPDERAKTPVTNTRPTVQNGGLVGTGKPAPKPKPQPEVESASTTEDGTTATSSEAVPEPESEAASATTSEESVE